MSDSTIYRILGQRAAERRAELGLTQSEVASRIGLTRASLANIEGGRQKLMLHHVYRLVEALELESILGLLPARLMPVDVSESLQFGGSVLSDAEKAQVKQMLDRALLSIPKNS
jgi:transcriptional regulator with XRE-family HTH domain